MMSTQTQTPPNIAAQTRPLRHFGLPACVAALLLLAALLLPNLSSAPVQATALAQAGTLDLEHTVNLPTAEPVPPENSLLQFEIQLLHRGGDTPAETVVRFPLPEGTRLAARPRLTTSAPDAVNTRNVRVSREAISWQGQIQPSGILTLTVAAELQPCFGGIQTISSTAFARQTDDTRISDSARFEVACSESTIDTIEVEQALIQREHRAQSRVSQREQPYEPALVPGVSAAISTTVRNTGQEAQQIALVFHPQIWGLQLSGWLTSTLHIPAVEYIALDAGDSHTFTRPVIDMDDSVSDTLLLEQPVSLFSRITYCLSHAADELCPNPEQNPDVAAWDDLEIPLRPNDLGDAPDSTNHFGVAMRAYPGVQANFPTVFDLSTGTPPGPLHRHPRPFHLGQRVSLEAEADVGPDQDPSNNIMPNIDQPNRDRFDDGVRVGQLNHCELTTLEVQVFIHPAGQAALLHKGIDTGYINAWVDGTRDGDWDDFAQCGPDGLEAGLEHFVIDHPVDIASLTPGLNSVTITGTSRVIWPEEQKEQPAWLRVTLSEAPSVKLLGQTYGDGRGPDTPFRTGETEDYLINRSNTTERADVVIRKWGSLEFARRSQPADGTAIWGDPHIDWVIDYHNAGSVAAQDVVIRDQLANDLNIIAILEGIRSSDNLPVREEGDTLVFDVGTLPPGAGGKIVIRTGLPELDVDIVRNLATISASNDPNTTNNQAAAQVRSELPAPLITGPGSGTTCRLGVTLSGRAVPGAEVRVQMTDVLITAVTANDQGFWSADIVLEPGQHQLTAIAQLDGQTSPPAQPITLHVDPSLPYDLLSLRFTDERGHSFRPYDPRGRMGDGNWRLHVRPNTSYTVEVGSCCTAPDTQMKLTLNRTTDIELSDPDADGLFTGSFKTGETDNASFTLELIVVCADIEYSSDGTVLIDPEGVVYDAQTGLPLSDATVACLVVTDAGNASSNTNPIVGLWPAADFGQINPQTTLDDGYFSFWTPPGTYQLDVTRSGYQSYLSNDIEVVDELVRRDVHLTPIIEADADQSIVVDEQGFATTTLTVASGTVIEWLNLGTDEHRVMLEADASTTSWDSGMLDTGESYTIRLDDVGVYTFIDAENSLNQATIVVEENRTLPVAGQSIYLPFIRR
jgi:plastocyanin